MKNNLFYYATSELSQDAFICYLLSFAMKEYENRDPNLASCAREFLRKMMGDKCPENIEVTEIERQHKKIDVLVTVNEKMYIIIEDKTFSKQHGNQIDEYKKLLIKENKPEQDIHCVYFKPVAQDHPEQGGVVNITRNEMLAIFNNYKSSNQIYIDYVERIRDIDRLASAFKGTPIEKWDKCIYNGFFDYLTSRGIVDISKDFSWDSGRGTPVLWWYSLDGQNIRKGLLKNYIKSIDLKLSGDTIAIIISVKDSSGINEVELFRQQLQKYINEANLGIKTPLTKAKKHMQIGSVKFNEENYLDQISKMEMLIKKIERGIPY